MILIFLNNKGEDIFFHHTYIEVDKLLDILRVVLHFKIPNTSHKMYVDPCLKDDTYLQFDFSLPHEVVVQVT